MEPVSTLFSTSTALGCFTFVTALVQLSGYLYPINYLDLIFPVSFRKDDLEFWNINELLLEPCCALKYFPDIEVGSERNNFHHNQDFIWRFASRRRRARGRDRRQRIRGLLRKTSALTDLASCGASAGTWRSTRRRGGRRRSRPSSASPWSSFPPLHSSSPLWMSSRLVEKISKYCGNTLSRWMRRLGLLNSRAWPGLLSSWTMSAPSTSRSSTSCGSSAARGKWDSFFKLWTLSTFWPLFLYFSQSCWRALKILP